MARTVGSRELKTRLGRYLRIVRRGEALVVTDRGEPVARLVPLEEARGATVAGRLAALADLGLIRLPSREGFTRARPARLRGRPLSDDILEDRGDRA
jgi:prevent-host-death family protein